MKLKVLKKGAWKIVSPLNQAGECPLENELNKLRQDRKIKASVIGLDVLMERSIDEGPRIKLSKELFHYVDKEEGIYEFIKGRLRLLCFEADGAVIICSHVFMKKTDKTRAQDKSPAIALKKDYLRAKAINKIEFIDEGEN
jgi:hypothetical protein